MRHPRPRPLGEHLQTLTRLIRQVDANSGLAPERRQRIKKALGEAMAEIQAELEKL